MAFVKDRRRGVRVPYSLPVTITWTEQDGNRDYYMTGKCVEVSTAGLRIELPRPIAYLTFVTLRVAGMSLAISGRVRHCRISGMNATMGLELSQPMSEQFLDALRSGKSVENSKRWQD
jgi:hypothetical protein